MDEEIMMTEVEENGSVSVEDMIEELYMMCGIK